MTIIKTPRLTIRELRAADAELWSSYSCEESARRELPDEVKETAGYALEVIEGFRNNYPFSYPLVYAVESNALGHIIGHIGLSAIAKGIEIGYALGEAHRGNGYAAEAIAAFSPWAKAHASLDTLYAEAKSQNPASWKSLERAGYVLQEEKPLKSWGVEHMFRIYTY